MNPVGEFLLSIASGVVVGLIVSIPFYRNFRQRRLTEDRRAERIDATCDAVIGHEADANVGRERTSGLKELVPDMKTKLEGVEKTVADIATTVDQISKSQTNLAGTVQEHIDEDELRFSALGHPGLPTHAPD